MPSRSKRASPAQPADVPPAQVLPITELIPNPENPRRHPERQLESLAASLRMFGQVRPIVARASDKVVLAGHGVLEAAKRVGLDHVDVILVDWDEHKAKAYMLADNRLPELARDDADAIAAILAEIDQFELDAVGFTLEEAKLFKSIAEPVDVEITDIDVSEVRDEFWVSVHGPLARQASVLHVLEQIAADHPDVELRLGMVHQS